ncbi:hypothetical protein LTR85_009414 [Meristemomyces frigidus]|nr:hypothetical protein LTR85_009414 [Meristemomyces frigidus]
MTLALKVLMGQYDRYCTVFETILLGRYLNQVLECETDLNMLSSSQSAVKPEWLITLLASALQPKIQESVRKFVGSWIMRSCFRPDISDAFADFLRTAFLPWATLGSLYTSTLRKEHGKTRCGHGEQLANYISTLLQQAVKFPPGGTQLLDIFLETLARSKSGRFAYAGVYLLEGLGRALEATPETRLQPVQLEKVAGLASWAALPEVARDYVYARCIKMCFDTSLRSPQVLQAESVVDAFRRWGELQATLSHQNSQAAGGTREPIATQHFEPSKRDIMQSQAVEKCERLRNLLKADDTTPAEAETLLEDIWSDLEYLEYPRALLMAMPALVLHARIVSLTSSWETLAEMLTKLVRKFQELSENRVYLMTPLVCAARNLVLAVPEAVKRMRLEDFVIQYTERIPAPTVDLQLEDATAQLLQSLSPEIERFGYEYYFGDREPVGIAALLDLVSRLSPRHLDVARAMFDRLLQRWAKQKTPPPIVSPWKSTLQLQVILLCCEQVVPLLKTPELLQVLRDLHHILSIEPLPRYRFLLGWMLARIYLKHKDLRPRILNELKTHDHHSNPKYLASLMKVAVMVAKLDTSDGDYALELASALVPLAASSKVIIRHEAQWQFPVLMDHARAMDWHDITASPACASLDDYIRSLQRFDDPPLERRLDQLDPVKDHTLTNLVEGSWFGLDSIEPSLCGREDFVKLYKTDAEAAGSRNEELPASCMPLGDPVTPLPSKPTAQGDGLITSAAGSKAGLAPSQAGESLALQTKGAAYLATGIENSIDQPTRRRNDLIVVASLVDNPYNLGGLSRVSEIFGASELHLRSQNVTSNKDFTSVSVSSHLHFPIVQLSATAVPAYLAGQRDRGWTVVGIEQTDRSVLLGSPDCKLPEKVVLVLGSEKEGIPALVLSECDMLVEIPQQGVTRSLNVQTAASIVLFEYARQRRGTETL